MNNEKNNCLDEIVDETIEQLEEMQTTFNIDSIEASFVLCYNENNVEHPVMGDDTSYFLDFSDYDTAYACMLLLNSKKVQDYLFSISFQDAKRPYTKKVLSSISLRKAVEKVTLQELIYTEQELELEAKIDNDMYNKLKNMLNTYQISITEL